MKWIFLWFLYLRHCPTKLPLPHISFPPLVIHSWTWIISFGNCEPQRCSCVAGWVVMVAWISQKLHNLRVKTLCNCICEIRNWDRDVEFQWLDAGWGEGVRGSYSMNICFGSQHNQSLEVARNNCPLFFIYSHPAHFLHLHHLSASLYTGCWQTALKKRTPTTPNFQIDLKQFGTHLMHDSAFTQYYQTSLMVHWNISRPYIWCGFFLRHEFACRSAHQHVFTLMPSEFWTPVTQYLPEVN
jgi:hypothetical protein